jgi:hypothetical protein
MFQPEYRVYGRYSGEGQRGNSSVERQMDMDHYRAQAAVYGLPFREIPYFDNAKSGYHGDNLEAELGKIFADIKSGALPPGSIIGTESHSRLGRLSANEALYQYLDILRAGIKLDIKGRALRTWESIGGLSGVLVLMEDFIDMVIAHKHSADLSKIERDTNAIKRRQVVAGQIGGTMKKGGPGWFVGRRCPAWLYPVTEPVIVEGRPYLYDIDEAVARVVHMIFEWSEHDGTVVIAGRLNAMLAEQRQNGAYPELNLEPLGNKHRTKKKIASWSHGQVLALLKNRAVLGEWQPHTRSATDEDGRKLRYRRKVKEGDPRDYYPPIITFDQWQRTKEGIAGRRGYDKNGRAIGKGGNTGVGFGNLVQGLAHCECCDSTVTLWSRATSKANPKAGKCKKYLYCDGRRRKMIFPQEHRLAGQRCPNKYGVQYPRFEALLLALFDTEMRPLLAALTPQPDRDNQPHRKRVDDIEARIDRRRRAHHAREVELDDLSGDERRESRVRMRELLAEITALEVERDRVGLLIRNAERLSRDDFDKRVRTGIARITQNGSVKCGEARRELNNLLAERVSITMHADRTMTVAVRGGQRTGVVRFGHDTIVDAGVLDEFGRRLVWMDDVWLVLANHVMRHPTEAVAGRRKLLGWVNEALDEVLGEAA